MPKIQLFDLGTLSSGQNQELWHGNISLRNRLASGELNQNEIDQHLRKINDFFVNAVPGSALRCVDGSSSDGYKDDDKSWRERPLGPQIQGGSVDEAIAMRLIKGVNSNDSLANDLDELVSSYQSEFKVGDHTDNLANSENTGCGAIQGQKTKLQMYNDSACAAVIESTAATIFSLNDLKPPVGVFEKIQTSASSLLELQHYIPDATVILNKLRQLNPEGLESLIRPHGEVSLTINFVPGTTFHRDHYNARSESKIQNFNLDVWLIFQEFDADMSYALIVDAVATVMDLTDGSLRLLARMASPISMEQVPIQALVA